MNSEVEVLAFIPKSVKTEELFKNVDDLTYIEDKNKLIDIININNRVHPRLVIVDIEYVLNKEHAQYLDIKDDLMYKNASIVIYGKNIDHKTNNLLYTLDIKGIIDEQNSNKYDVFSHIKRRTNLYSSTFKNNSIRAMIEFHDLGDTSKRLTYLLDYLILKYNISDIDAADIRLALISLLTAFKQNKILQTAKLINTIFKSQSVNKFYQSHTKPKSFNEEILAILLKFYTRRELSEYVDNINISTIKPQLVQDIQQICNEKIISITSYQDINFFWEQLHLNLLDLHSNETIQIIDTLLDTTYKILEYFLIHSNYLLVSADLFNSKEIKIDCKFIADMNLIKEHIKSFSNSVNIVLDKNDSTKVSIIFDISNEAVEITQCKGQVSQNLTIDTTNINSMHYDDNKKISATDFLRDFEIDDDLLADLKDHEEDIKALLYKEELVSQDILNSVAEVLQKYSVVLYETIEFEDIAYSLTSLAKLFATTSVSEIEESKFSTLGFYLQGLIDDLSSWKNHIFIEMSTPDIHYLDASLLENSATIEKFILSSPEDSNSTNEDEDDLEFF